MKLIPLITLALQQAAKLAPIVLLVIITVTSRLWWPTLTTWVDAVIASRHVAPTPEPTESAEHDEHDHGEGLELPELQLTEEAQYNLGLTKDYLRILTKRDFSTSLSIPALVVEQPGRTQLHVSTPLTGVITHVHITQGEAVSPGALLFEIRLTHEDLVQAQVDFLRTLGELDVEVKEIHRLQAIAATGAVAGKLLLDREYEQEKLEAALSAQRESLRLHGLNAEQVEEIATQRRLLRELQVFAPSRDTHEHEQEYKLLQGEAITPVILLNDTGSTGHRHDEHGPADPPLVLHTLLAHKGQSVTAGQTLGIIGDYSRLYIEGNAFAHDAGTIASCLQQKRVVQVISEHNAQTPAHDHLTIDYIASEIDPVSRALHFYISLPNEILTDSVDSQHRRYVTWRHRPGQRLTIKIPLQDWNERIVLPAEAVAMEGEEAYVFRRRPGYFQQVPVKIDYRDRQAVVIADGILIPGDVIAYRGAHQMLMAQKNKGSGASDPHAGHDH